MKHTATASLPSSKRSKAPALTCSNCLPVSRSDRSHRVCPGYRPARTVLLGQPAISTNLEGGGELVFYPAWLDVRRQRIWGEPPSQASPFCPLEGVTPPFIQIRVRRARAAIASQRRQMAEHGMAGNCPAFCTSSPAHSADFNNQIKIPIDKEGSTTFIAMITGAKLFRSARSCAAMGT